MTKQQDRELTKLEQYFENHVTPSEKRRLEDMMGWTSYQRSTRYKNPKEWSIREVSILADFIAKPWEDCVKEFGVASKKLCYLITS